MLGERNRGVGVVRADDGETAGVDEPVERLDAFLGSALRQARVLFEDELVTPVEHAAFDALVEGHTDLALEVAPLHAEPADADRFEPQPPFFPGFALFSERRRPPAVRQEAGVAAAAPSALGRQEPVAFVDEISEDESGVVIAHDRSLGDRDPHVAATRPVPALALAMDTALGTSMRMVPEGEQ